MAEFKHDTITEAEGEQVVDLERDLALVLNRYSQENASNTPDFILAKYLLGCLTMWNRGVQQRESWYGCDVRPTGGDGSAPESQS